MSTVHMVSSTNSEEQVLEALGRRNAPAAEPTVPAEAATAAGETTENQETEQKHKKGGWQRKIEKLEAQLEAEKSQRQELLDRLAGKPAEKTVEATAGDDEPELAKFDTYEKYVKALTSWTVRQEAKKFTEQQASADIADFQKEVAREFSVKVEGFKEAHPDYDDVLAADVPIYQGVQQAIMEMDNGPEVAYFLGKHPDIASKMMEMSPAKAIAEAGKISAQLTKPETPVTKKPVSNAPAPIRPVGGGSAITHTGEPGKRSLQQYRQLRESGQI